MYRDSESHFSLYHYRTELYPFKMDAEETNFVITEIKSLIDKQVLQVVGRWVSNIFLRPKPNGKFRMVLDLTELNKNVLYEHFNMFNLKTVLNIVQPGIWMASADLTDVSASM